MVYVQENKGAGTLFVVIPLKIVEQMNIKKGDEVAFVVDSPEIARMRVIR